MAAFRRLLRLLRLLLFTVDLIHALLIFVEQRHHNGTRQVADDAEQQDRHGTPGVDPSVRSIEHISERVLKPAESDCRAGAERHKRAADPAARPSICVNSDKHQHAADPRAHNDMGNARVEYAQNVRLCKTAARVCQPQKLTGCKRADGIAAECKRQMDGAHADHPAVPQQITRLCRHQMQIQQQDSKQHHAEKHGCRNGTLLPQQKT